MTQGKAGWTLYCSLHPMQWNFLGKRVVVTLWVHCGWKHHIWRNLANLSILASALVTTLLSTLTFFELYTDIAKLNFTAIVTTELVKGINAVNFIVVYFAGFFYLYRCNYIDYWIPTLRGGLLSYICWELDNKMFKYEVWCLSLHSGYPLRWLSL